jgi:hypothetical protein
MKTITFKGKSEIIETNGNYTYMVIKQFTDKIVTPLVNFVYMDGEDDAEPIEIDFKYEVLYTISIFFETAPEDVCTITYELFK